MTTLFQPTILRFDSTDSTNLEAMRQARSGAPEGLCIVAREQTAGRGRLERTWHSPRDAGLYFSIILRPRLETKAWPLLTLMAALAVVDALFRSCGIRADIKWPNDVYIDEQKVCGILSETVDAHGGPAAVVGIGINVRKEAVPEYVHGTATSLEETTGITPDKDQLLNEILHAFAERYQMLQATGGCEHTIREWCASSSYAFDRLVRVSMGADNLEGLTRGLDSDGALRVETADGKISLVRAGDVIALRAAASDQ